MRRFLLAVVMCGVAAGAQAADMPDLPILRGGLTDGLSRSSVNWQGFYVGGQGGYGSSDMNFNGSNQAMTATMLANTAIESELGVSRWPLNLSKTTAQSSAYGAFTGYNWQWTDVVVGVEASYMHGKFGGASSASMRRFFSATLSDGYYHDITSSASSSIAISDMATLRARAAYSYGSFLPYAFAGVALGNADITRSVNVVDRFAGYLPPFNTPCSAAGTPFCFTPNLTYAQHNRLIYGYSFGVGTDINLIGGLFARAEWEYIRFTAAVDTTVNTVRLGLGYKF
jgi:outer membrane immunogenic protein